MSAAADLQDRRRSATRKVKRAMVEFLIDDDRFDALRIEDVKLIATKSEACAWDAVVEMSS